MVQLGQNVERKTPVLAYAYITQQQNEAVIEKAEAECGFRVKRMAVNNEDLKDILSQLPKVYKVTSIDCFCYVGKWVDEVEIKDKWYGIYDIPPWTDTYEYIALPVQLGEEIKKQAPWLPMQNTTIVYNRWLKEQITVVLGHVAFVLYTDIPLQKAVELKSQAPWLKVRAISGQTIYNVKDTEIQEVPLCAT
jgi:hypothetical protein